jgi:hypothetical protein
MNEPRPQDAEQEPAAVPYLRLPMPVVATGLFVFLAAVLGVGLWANANLRAPRSVTPATEAPTGVVVAAATQVIVATGTPVPLVQPTATAAVAAAIASTRPVAPTATYAPTPLVIVLDPTAKATPPSVQTEAPTSLPTVEPTLAAEVGQAYEHYWQVRAEALYQLDTSHLDEVMGGEHLADAETLVAQLRSDGHAILTDVSHQYAVLEVSNDEAKVADSYVDNSTYIDPNDHTKLSQPEGITLNELYYMSKLDGHWKVVSIARSPQ